MSPLQGTHLACLYYLRYADPIKRDNEDIFLEALYDTSTRFTIRSNRSPAR